MRVDTEERWMAASEPDATHIRNSAEHIYTVLLRRNKWNRSWFQKGRASGECFPSSAIKKQHHVIIMARAVDVLSPFYPPTLSLLTPAVSVHQLNHVLLISLQKLTVRLAVTSAESRLIRKRNSTVRRTQQNSGRLQWNKTKLLKNLVKNTEVKDTDTSTQKKSDLSFSMTLIFHSSLSSLFWLCFYITGTFVGKPRHPTADISLLWVCTLSDPVHPGVELGAWAGMENPTSV